MLRIDLDRAVLPDRVVGPASLLVQDDTIAAVGAPGEIGEVAAERIDRTTMTAVPGFVDTQHNGAGSHWWGEPGATAVLAAGLLRTGTTAVLPTLTGRFAADFDSALAAVATPVDGPATRIVGVHLEGPYLSEEFRGAHDRTTLQAVDLDAAAGLIDRSPVPIAIWTLAPELPDALALIRLIAERGVVASAGHTAATYDEMFRARDAGLSMVTHLFNGQRGLHHREPGTVGAALVLPDLWLGLIADGTHVDSRIVDLVLRIAGDRVVVVTDSVAAGSDDDAAFHDVRRLPDGTIAGSFATTDAVFRSVAERHGLVAAARLTATQPCDAIGRADLGRLAAGTAADVVLLDRDLAVSEVWLAGQTASA
jgi:N-acetylglucosamine-6-phosphate deacetylase